MNLKALITTLVLGSSSVAMAHPVSAPAPVSQPVYQPVSQPIYRGPMPPQYAPGYEPAVYQPQYQHPSWVSLGSVDHIVDGQMTFRLGRAGRAGRFSGAGEQFSTLKLQSEAGKSLIQRVLIQFSNGRTQVVEVNQYLNASNPAITIDLEGRTRTIAKVTVIGRNARQSAYRVLAI